jgi:hypothetical protein
MAEPIIPVPESMVKGTSVELGSQLSLTLATQAKQITQRLWG